MPVSLKDILGAFKFVCAGGGVEHQAFLCKQSGKLYCHSGLDLGKPLALDFARQFLPGDFDDVRQFFSRRGTYARFKDLLARRGVLDQWYDFEANRGKSTEDVVRS